MEDDKQNPQEIKDLGIMNKLLVYTVFVALIFGIVWLFTINSSAVEATGQISTQANLKVAFIGDSGYGSSFVNVLNLIKSEGAEAVFHQGDFDYSDNPNGFFPVIDSVLGTNFPYFASVGNHDASEWNDGCSGRKGCYATHLKNRMMSIGVSPDDPNLNDQMYSIVYKGLKVVFVGEEDLPVGDAIYAPYIASQLENDQHIWKICSWHKNQEAMQVGGESDKMGWSVYEACRMNGAIVANAHEHSYHRTKTLSNMQLQTVDTVQHPLDQMGVPGNPDSLLVSQGRTFAFVSGAGGRDIRSQDRCLPTTYPYGCHFEWAKIYTSSQGAVHGALFMTFNVDGDPNKAVGYFKNINGQIVDQFTIMATSSATTQCSDTYDNDSDTLIDLNDPGCSSASDNDETNIVTPPPPPTDTIPPLTSITSPANNSIVLRRSNIVITASGSDDVGLTKVDFYVNGLLMCSDPIDGYSCNWQVPNSPGKTYNLQTKAYDLAGNVGNSVIVTVKSK